MWPIIRVVEDDGGDTKVDLIPTFYTKKDKNRFMWNSMKKYKKCDFPCEAS